MRKLLVAVLVAGMIAAGSGVSRADERGESEGAGVERFAVLPDGVRFPDNKEMKFSRLDPMGTRSAMIHAEGRWMPPVETDPDPEGRATVCVAFGPQYGPVTAAQVEILIRAASRRGYDDLLVAGFASFHV